MDFNAVNSVLIRLDVELLSHKMNSSKNEDIVLIDALHDKIHEARKLIHIHLGLPTE